MLTLGIEKQVQQRPMGHNEPLRLNVYPVGHKRGQSNRTGVTDVPDCFL